MRDLSEREPVRESVTEELVLCEALAALNRALRSVFEYDASNVADAAECDSSADSDSAECDTDNEGFPAVTDNCPRTSVTEDDTLALSVRRSERELETSLVDDKTVCVYVTVSV